MVSTDDRIRRKILQHIKDHGEISKFDALRMCENTAQLVRIIPGLVERDGFLTTKEELADRIAPSPERPLLRGHCCHGIGGSWVKG
jgi:hypothetical protein